ncbi:gluconokinase [Chitinophagaceae bacterium LB-8]|uniref:Gluconokinase n=1 Tax=Paraflavisolibacter caeni TaxID=2982496 RepID=A0A9X2XXF4_9BACT|nr:gluconokinase [Paraflavisolibacter caeni]MCU7550860.1 gluconokinase [Paraflavisolibacter caeni]
MPTYFLGVDIGTGSTKAVALDLKGKTLFSTQIYYDTLQAQTGYSEQRPDEIFKAFVKSIGLAVNQLKENPTAISLSAVMHSVIPVDENGRPLANMLTWADSRSYEIAERIQASAEAESLYEATGTPIHAMSPLCKIIWWKENKPEIFSRALKFISIKEYIWFKLFQQFQVDYSTASATGLLHTRQLKWHDEALKLAGITPAQLSVPVSPGLVRYDLPEAVAHALHVEASTPFIIGASDGCLANLGSSVMSKSLASITIGTSGAVRIASDKPVINFQSMLFNYLLDEGVFISGGSINNGGIAVKWCTENLLQKSLKDDYDELLRQIESIEAGSKGLLFLPYLMGERAPIWDSKAKGVFLGVTIAHDNTHFLRAVVEGVCFALNDVLQKIEQSAGQINKIHVSGGLFKSKFFIQMLANVTGKSLQLMQTEDASAIGAVYLALKALGYVETFEDLPHQEASYTCEPQPEEHEKYSTFFKIYSQIYPQLKNMMHDLHTIQTDQKMLV